MKYSVTYGFDTIEFLELSDAIAYAGKFGLGPDVVQIVENDPTQSFTVDDIFQKKISEGYNIPGTPYYLAMADSDRAQFSAMLGLVNQALNLGMITTETPQTILDKSGYPVTISTLQFQQIMVGYGFYYVTIWGQRNAGG